MRPERRAEVGDAVEADYPLRRPCAERGYRAAEWLHLPASRTLASTALLRRPEPIRYMMP